MTASVDVLVHAASRRHALPDTQEMPRPAAALVVGADGPHLRVVHVVDFFRDDMYLKQPMHRRTSGATPSEE